MKNFELKKSDFLLWFLYTISALYLLLIRISVPVIDWDESVYMLVAKEWLNGNPPYTVVWDHKPPGIYFLFASVFSIFGPSVSVIRLFCLVITFLSGLLLYGLGKPFLGRFAFFIPFFYLFLANTVGQGAANTEIFANFFYICAIYLIFKSRKDNYLFISLAGLCLGMAFIIRYHVGFDILAFYVFCAIFKDSIFKTSFFKKIISFTIGLVAPFLIASFYFYLIHKLGVFLDANFTANFIHASDRPYHLFGFFLRWGAFYLDQPLAYLFLVASIMLFSIIKNSRIHLSNTPLFVSYLPFWFIGSNFGVFLTGQTYPHYALQIVPSLILLVIFFFLKISKYFQNRKFLYFFIFFIGFNLLVFSYTQFSFIKNYKKRTSSIDQVVDFIKENSSSQDTIYIRRGDPIIYFLSERKSSSKYLSPTFLTNEHFKKIACRGHCDAELDSIFFKKPKFIFTNSPDNEKDEYFLRLLNRDYFLKKSIGNYVVYETKS